MKPARTAAAPLARALITALAAILLAGCTNIVFHPLRPHVFDPRDKGIAYEDRSVSADDGVVLHGWWLPAVTSVPPEPAAARGTVVFLHGNAENISTHIASVHWLPAAGYNVYLYDYRGFGKSRGDPDYARSRRDLRAVLAAVADYPEVRGRPLFVFGQSLGGAIALSALGGDPARLRLAGVVVEGAPASLRRAAREALGGFWLTWPLQVPLSWLIEDADSPRERIGGIAPVPLLVAHSRDDRVVRFEHGRTLHAAAPGNTVWFEAGGPHIRAFVPPEARRVLLDFLAAPPPTAPRDRPER